MKIFDKRAINKLSELGEISDKVVENVNNFDGEDKKQIESIGKLVLEGHSNKEISKKLNISLYRVETTCRKYAFKKLFNKEFYFSLDKKHEKIQNILKLPYSSPSIGSVVDKRSYCAIRYRYDYFNIHQAKRECILESIKKTKNVHKTARELKMNIRTLRLFFYNHQDLLKEHNIKIDIRYRTPADETKKRNKQILKMRKAGETVENIAKKFDIKESNVRCVLSNLNIQKNNRKRPLDKGIVKRNQSILKMYKKGMSYKEISDVFEIVPDYVGKIINDTLNQK